MTNKSPLGQAKELANQLNSLIVAFDIDVLQPGERAILTTAKRQMVDARLEVRDYELADTRAEQQRVAVAAKQYLEQLQASIVKASEYNLFGAVDVAQLSAHIQQIISDIE